jgi:hypothetical protein
METAVDNLVMLSGQNVQSNAAAVHQMSMQCQRSRRTFLRAN